MVEPHYPKVGEAGGRPPIPLERMLRVYFLQLWFNLSDPAVEEALYDSVAMRSFAGVDLGHEGAPDETTVCKFRHLLERHKLGKKLLATVNGYPARNGIKISNGTIVDATIISAPSSTKNKDGKRDPEMHQTAKGKQWYFGMKAHVVVDSRHKLIHTVLVSAANVADRLALPHLLRGKEACVSGDQATRAIATLSNPSLRGLATASTGATDGGSESMRRSRPRIATSLECVRRSSTASGPSSACSASRWCATVAWRRICIACRSPRRRRTCSPCGGGWQHRGDAGESRHTGAKSACPPPDHSDLRASNGPHKRIGRRGRHFHGLFKGALTSTLSKLLVRLQYSIQDRPVLFTLRQTREAPHFVQSFLSLSLPPQAMKQT